MKKYQQNTDGTDITHAEKIDLGEHGTHMKCAIIGKLVDDDVSRNNPTKEKTREKTTNWQEYLTSDKIK